MATTRMRTDVRQLLSPAIVAVPLGLFAALVAVYGASVNPLLPLVVGGGAVIAAFAYLRPLWLLLLAIVLLPFEFELQTVAFFDLSPSKAFFLLAAAGWIAAQIAHRRPLIASSPITLPLIAVVLTILPGLVIAAEPLVVFNKLAVWVAGFFLFQAILQADDEVWVRRILIAFGISAVGLGFLAITDTDFQAQAANAGGTFVSNRATGGLNNPNGLAALILLCALPAAAMSFTGPLWRRYVLAGAATVGVVGILLTQSRGGFLALAAGLLILTTWRPIRRLAVGAVVIVAVLAFGGINPLGDFLDESAVGDRLTSITTTAPESDPRIAIYKSSVVVIEDHPIFGVGTADFQSAALEYGIVIHGAALTHAHNGPLTLAAERGVVGLLAVIWFAIAIAQMLARGLGAAHGERRAMLTAVMAVFVACTAHLMVDYTLGGPTLLSALFVLAGCGAVIARRALADAPAPVPAGDVAFTASPVPGSARTAT